LIFPALPGDRETPETDFIARTLPPEYQVRPIAGDGIREIEFDFRLEAE
jgi:hypothetical protein